MIENYLYLSMQHVLNQGFSFIIYLFPVINLPTFTLLVASDVNLEYSDFGKLFGSVKFLVFEKYLIVFVPHSIKFLPSES